MFVIPEDRTVSLTEFRMYLVQILEDVWRIKANVFVLQDGKPTGVVGIEHPGDMLKHEHLKDTKIIRNISVKQVQENLSQVFTSFKGGIVVFKVKLSEHSAVFLYRHPEYTNPYDSFVPYVIGIIEKGIRKELEEKNQELQSKIEELTLKLVSNEEIERIQQEHKNTLSELEYTNGVLVSVRTENAKLRNENHELRDYATEKDMAVLELQSKMAQAISLLGGSALDQESLNKTNDLLLLQKWDGKEATIN